VPGALDATATAADLSLLGRAKGGDRGALAELLARHQERLRRIVRVRLGPALRRHLQTTDIVQETYRAALQGLERLDLSADPDLLSWLAKIAVHRIRDEHDRLHAQKRDVGREVPLGDEGGSQRGAGALPAAAGTTPSEGAFHSELHELLDACLAELPESWREAILLRDYCGASWEHVASELGSPTLHAAQQLHQRAWIRLRRLVLPRLRGVEGS